VPHRHQDRTPLEVVVIGASLSGLFAAAAAARAGCAVTVLERDALPERAQARSGVPQSRQCHVLLHRGLLAAAELVPGLEQDLVAAGAVRLDTGRLPWFGPYGWQPTDVPSYDILSLTRPLLEHVVRRRVLDQPGVTLAQDVRVQHLRRSGGRWAVTSADGGVRSADLVVDASGRASRMPHWLAALGVAVDEPEVVDARVGYACRLYRSPSGRPPTGIVLQATPELPRGGLGLPVEDGGWLVGVSGYGDHRPGREDFDGFLATLRDPLLARVADTLEPLEEVAVHRQTANRRHHFGRRRDWPAGLLVVGDALCAFNPIYGQGITVGACQAQVLGRALDRPGPLRTRALQRRLAAVADLPWAIATGSDRTFLPEHGPSPVAARLVDLWTTQVGLLLLAGDRRAARTFGRVYHLMGSPREFLHPGLVLSVLRRSLTAAAVPVLPSPALDELLGVQPLADGH
jgi:2-polyprenyl-6-methoxyphenol hydroxylase-like FAD-dependent oxidoreductase